LPIRAAFDVESSVACLIERSREKSEPRKQNPEKTITMLRRAVGGNQPILGLSSGPHAAENSFFVADRELADGERNGWPLVCGVSLHTFLMGQPHRAHQLKLILEHMAAQRSRVWFTTPGEIADHVSALPAGTVAIP
jgi:hypothetical protein